MDWRETLRRFHVPLENVLYTELGQQRLDLDRLDAKAVRARRTALFGACSAAATCVDLLAPHPHPTGEPVWVPLDRARCSFERAAETPDPGDALQRLFRPTVFLFEESLRGRGGHSFCIEDDAAPPGIYTGLVALVSVTTPRVRTLGEAFFVPPVTRHDGAARAAWIESRQLDPPRRGEIGGPFWRLGRQGIWRLEVLSWNEILVLAALVGTAARQTVVVAPRHLLPRIGFVADLARQMERTLIGVPLEACPRPLRGMLREVHDECSSTELSLFWGSDFMEGETLAAHVRPRRPRR